LELSLKETNHMGFGGMGAGRRFGAMGIPLGGSRGPVLNLSASSYPANSATNTVIGTLSVTGGTGTYTYTFTSNPGTLFNISTASLRDNTGTNGAGSYPITIKADNGAGSVVSKAFLITATAASTGSPMGLLLALTQ
jgi:hypothetical protein